MKALRLTEVISFRVPKPILAEIDKIAAREERKRADIVRRLFVRALQLLKAEG